MKYMGNKSKLLPKLKEVIERLAKGSNAIADPFCGSASVSWFLAENTKKRIIAGDIQEFAVARARAVIERDFEIRSTTWLDRWIGRATSLVGEIGAHFPNNLRSIEPDLKDDRQIRSVVHQSRKFCRDVLPVVFKKHSGEWPLSKAYGGYYFSPVQALIFDALRKTLPSTAHLRSIALAALVEAASRASASPGHTAQPFQPTRTAAKYIVDAWSKDPWQLVSAAANEIASKTSQVSGKAVLGDFYDTISLLDPGDLVFADPPYSDVHYSRFYHVLETVIRGREFLPSGSGRYPHQSLRPSSAFSVKSRAVTAACELLEACWAKELKLVVTFPTTTASNGLSAEDFIEIGKPLFSRIESESVASDFSTLGGTRETRGARKSCGESILSFVP